MKHNVGIITVIYSTNCGSVLQALALQDAYNKLGCNVSFISTINKLSALSYKKEFKDVIKALVSRSSPGAVMKKYRDSGSSFVNIFTSSILVELNALICFPLAAIPFGM